MNRQLISPLFVPPPNRKAMADISLMGTSIARRCRALRTILACAKHLNFVSGSSSTPPAVFKNGLTGAQKEKRRVGLKQAFLLEPHRRRDWEGGSFSGFGLWPLPSKDPWPAVMPLTLASVLDRCWLSAHSLCTCGSVSTTCFHQPTVRGVLHTVLR